MTKPTRRRPEAALTRMEARTLRCLTAFWRRFRQPPTMIQMAYIVGRSPPTIHKHLNALHQKHWVRKTGPSGDTKWTPLNLCPQCGSVVETEGGG